MGRKNGTRGPVSLEWVDRPLCARLPQSMRSNLVGAVKEGTLLPRNIRRLVMHELKKIAETFNPEQRRPARKRHAAAVITADGWVFFGVNHRDEDTYYVWCAEASALAIAATYGRSEFVASVLFSPDYQPVTCDHCRAKLAASRTPGFAAMVGQSFGPGNACILDVIGPDFRAYSQLRANGDAVTNGERMTQSSPRPRLVVLQLDADQLAELSTDRLREGTLPIAVSGALETHLRGLLHHSTYHMRPVSGVAPSAVAVVTSGGKVYCGVNVYFGNPPDCMHALQGAIAAACTAGDKAYRYVHVVREDGSHESQPARNPFLGHLPMLEPHVDPALTGADSRLPGDIAIAHGDRLCLYSSLVPSF